MEERVARRRFVALAWAVAFAAVPAAWTFSKARRFMAERPAVMTADQAVAGWPPSRVALEGQLVEEYGPPQEATARRLVWTRRGPWSRIVLLRDGPRRDFPRPHHDVLEQTVAYAVPPGKFSDLSRFDGSLLADRTAGTLTARGESEAANVLALNLADRIARGKLGVAEARLRYARIERLALAGKRAGEAEKLMFSPQSGTADPDAPIDWRRDRRNLHELFERPGRIPRGGT